MTKVNFSRFKFVIIGFVSSIKVCSLLNEFKICKFFYAGFDMRMIAIIKNEIFLYLGAETTLCPFAPLLASVHHL